MGLLLAALVAVITLTTGVHISRLLQAQYLGNGYQGDYAIFGEMSRTLLDGRRMYVDFWDIKPPGMFFALAPFIATLGHTAHALYTATVGFFVLFIAAATALSYALTRSRVATLAGLGIAMLYCGIRGGPETTFLMMTFSALAAFCAICGRGRALWMIGAGLLFTAGAITKQPILSELPALALFAYFNAPRLRWRAVFWLGLGLLLGVGLILFWSVGLENNLAAMWDRAFVIVTQYVVTNDGSWHFRADSLASFQDYFLRYTVPFFGPLALASLASVLILVFNRKLTSNLRISILWWVLATFAASVARGLRPDYFTQMLPPLIALTVQGIVWVPRMSMKWRLAVVAVGLLLAVLFSQRVVAPLQPFSEPSTGKEDAVVSLIHERSTQDDCLWTWGNLSLFYYLSGRLPCASPAHSGFMMDATTFPITRTRVEYMNEMLESHPRLLVTDTNWGYFPTLNTYAENYVVEMIYEQHPYTVYRVDRSMWHAARANFGGEIGLRGYDLLPQETPICPDDALTLAITWEQLSTPTRQYQMFVQLLTEDEMAQIGGYDGPPQDNRRSTATNTWVDQGEIRISQRFALPIREDAAPGSYKLVVGLYDVETTERLPVLDASGTQTGTYAILQDIVLDDTCGPTG
jgi:hypothetical protein